jgi:sugar phosphate isomerase/epimerase
VPSLGLVWDLNHTRPEDRDRFLALRERFTLVHVSDTPLPETNHHLPLGRGNVDYGVVRDLDDVPVVLEIGGLPHSGGPGLDTDEALLDSRERLLTGARSH